MEASRAADQAVRLLVGRAAHFYYSGLEADEQAAIRKDFDAMDASHDGRISLREFMGALSNKRNDFLLPKLFAFLDVDFNGFLDFSEYVIVNYLLRPGGAGLRMCESCEAPILLVGYTCLTCREERGSNGALPFNLCFKCYGARSFSHHHSTLVDSLVMYNMLLSKHPVDHPQEKTVVIDQSMEDPPSQAQCCICGDYHRNDINAMLVFGRKHMMETQDASGEFVCEWCFSWGCNKCGKFFQGSSSTSTPGKWLNVDICCTPCGTFGNMTNREGIFKKLAESELSHRCKTCAIKMKNGLLWGNHKRNKALTADMSLEAARRMAQVSKETSAACSRLVYSTEEEERKRRSGYR